MSVTTLRVGAPTTVEHEWVTENRISHKPATGEIIFRAETHGWGDTSLVEARMTRHEAQILFNDLRVALHHTEPESKEN